MNRPIQLVRDTMGRALAATMEAILGRRLFARVTRYLWRRARLDFSNEFSLNGERRVIESLARRLEARAELRVLDVGANVGDWSAQLLERAPHPGVGGSGLEMHLFEPAPAAARALRERFGEAMNRGTVSVRESAVAAEPGRARFFIGAPTAGTNALREAEPGAARHEVDVEVTTLDDYCEKQGISTIDFLKIDTEGNDLNVLAGARSLLESGAIEAAQFEYNWRWISFRLYLQDVFRLVEPLGYRIGKITPFGIETYARWDPELEDFWEGNFLVFKNLQALGLPEVRYWNEGSAER